MPRHFARHGAFLAWLIFTALGLSGCSLFNLPADNRAPQAGTVRPGPGPAIVPPPVETPPIETNPSATPSTPGLPPLAGSIKVAVLLPLSGPNGGLGRAMLDAAQMALFDSGGEALQLVPRDTKGEPAAAAAAAKAAIDEGARLIIGPLLRGEVETVKPVARAANVPVLAFSTDARLAGDGTYIFGFLPSQEIARVVGFARAQGRSRIAALIPKNRYGDLAVAALREAADATGARLGRIEIYDPAAPDFSAAVRHFAAGADDFDALLLPEGGNRLKALAPLLPYYHIDPAKVKFLGTGLWDDASLDTEPALAGGWYAAPTPAARTEFEKRYSDLYHRAPPRLASLAYDAVALAGALTRLPAGASFAEATLTNPGGFNGLDGLFRLRPDGLVERGLAVIEIHRTGPVIADPAPESFQGVGF